MGVPEAECMGVARVENDPDEDPTLPALMTDIRVLQHVNQSELSNVNQSEASPVNRDGLALAVKLHSGCGLCGILDNTNVTFVGALRDLDGLTYDGKVKVTHVGKMTINEFLEESN